MAISGSNFGDLFVRGPLEGGYLTVSTLSRLFESAPMPTYGAVDGEGQAGTAPAVQSQKGLSAVRVVPFVFMLLVVGSCVVVGAVYHAEKSMKQVSEPRFSHCDVAVILCLACAGTLY